MGNVRSTAFPICWLLPLSLGFCFCGHVLNLQAQFGSLVSPFSVPQSRSQQEFDDYLDVIVAIDAATTVQKAEKFASNYPESELLGLAFQHKMVAYAQMNSFEGTLQAGRTALELLPGNLNTLLTLASAIPDSSTKRDDEADLLREAEGYARQSLQSLATMQIPRQVRMQDWEKMKADMIAQAHEAPGHIATKRGDLSQAITELEMAAYGSPTPSGIHFFRLGVAYAAAGEIEPADKAFQRAVELGPELIRRRSMDALTGLKSKSTVAPEKPADHKPRRTEWVGHLAIQVSSLVGIKC
jgi:tetratricopeptide (TPR) repeat protein